MSQPLEGKCLYDAIDRYYELSCVYYTTLTNEQGNEEDCLHHELNKSNINTRIVWFAASPVRNANRLTSSSSPEK